MQKFELMISRACSGLTMGLSISGVDNLFTSFHGLLRIDHPNSLFRRFLFLTAMKIASKIVMFLPRNVDPNQLAELSLLSDPPWELEVSSLCINLRVFHSLILSLSSHGSYPSSVKIGSLLWCRHSCLARILIILLFLA